MAFLALKHLKKNISVWCSSLNVCHRKLSLSKLFVLLSSAFRLRDFFFCRKYEEIYPPEVAEFCYVTDDSYTKKQVQRMEQLVLEVLRFEFSPPTAHFFVNHFAKLSGLPGSTPRS